MKKSDCKSGIFGWWMKSECEKTSKIFPGKDFAPFCFLNKGRLFWKANFAKLEKISESKRLLLWIGRIREPASWFFEHMAVASIFYFIPWLPEYYFNRRFQNECMPEKNWRSKVVFLTCVSSEKMLSGSKDRFFYPPGEITGRESETHLHKRKVEILRCQGKRELSSNLHLKRKSRPEDQSAENQKKMVDHFGNFQNSSLQLKMTNF